MACVCIYAAVLHCTLCVYCPCPETTSSALCVCVCVALGGISLTFGSVARVFVSECGILLDVELRGRSEVRKNYDGGSSMEVFVVSRVIGCV